MRIKSTYKGLVGKITLTFKYSEVESKPSPAFPDKKTSLVPLVPVYFPLIDGTLIGYKCIIDSGAGYCFFHQKIGEEVLGLDVKKGAKLPNVKGVTGTSFDAYFHKIRFMIKGWGIDEAYVGFTDKLKTPYGILGQHDFFDVFQVIFNKSADDLQLVSTTPIEKGKIEPYEVTEALKIGREKRQKASKK